MGVVFDRLKSYRYQIIVGAFVAAGIGITVLLIVGVGLKSQSVDAARRGRLLTLYDRGQKQSFLTHAHTLKEALAERSIQLNPHDAVEPALDEELIASEYKINIYRARPVTVVDGSTRIKIITPYQSPQKIAEDAGITTYKEDILTLDRTDKLVSDGASLKLSINRAVALNLNLYGHENLVRTQGKTVSDLLKEKAISLGTSDRTSVGLATPIIAGMNLRIWREGRQTLSVDEAIPFDTKVVHDADREIGYRSVTTAGKSGIKNVTYQIEIKDGQEIARTLISELVTTAPTSQEEVVGIKPGPNALTKSKGAQYFIDSKGVSHRETYYDLPMGVVMQACGKGGYYSIRADGAKIDIDGYILVAANYGNYPRCSVVETSLGPGKVYDTGGFATRHPLGFDLATDWTNYDGR